MPARAAQAIKTPDDERVAWAELVEELCQLGAMLERA
ncbi:hypothetical protein JOE58_003248 [Curtobacterium luteum]|uniref:MarR family transcriptional regulator n=1 Tax=Curtobacterium luteum TaxID=33881 RepID=A0ABS2RZ83_9MICO|nr:hypothetical protein [Curtobacterium luteum]